MTVYNALFKSVTTQRDGPFQISNLCLGMLNLYLSFNLHTETVFLSLAWTDSLIITRMTTPESTATFHALTKNIQPTTCPEGTEGEQNYSPTLSLTSALCCVGWSKALRGRFTTMKKTQNTLYSGLCGLPGTVWTGAEILVTTGIRTPDRNARGQSLLQPGCYGPYIYQCFDK